MDYERLSRTVAHALRHEPWIYELEVDAEGWVPLPQLLRALRDRRRAWRDLDPGDLREMIRRADKRRFEIRGDRIRALYGHSLDGKLAKEEACPPDELFHGTSPGSLGRIREEGLMPMGRQYVHLSADRASAGEVGRRKADDPVILSVAAGEAHRSGVAFYRGNERVWLADRVPPRFVREGT